MKRIGVVFVVAFLSLGVAVAAGNMALPNSQYVLGANGTWMCSHDYWVGENGQVIGPATSPPPTESLVEIKGGSVERGYLLQRQTCSCTVVNGETTATRVTSTTLYAVPYGTGPMWYPKDGVVYRQLVRVTACYRLDPDGVVRASWHWLVPDAGMYCH